jgi:hypothetical protein
MNKLAQTGTQGLAVSQGTLGAANPLMQAFANAQAQQDLELASQAQAQGRAQTQFGQGLLGGAFDLMSGSYKPLTTALGAGQSVESLGQSALDIGAQLGGRSANAAGAQALMQGGLAAANSNAAANAYSPFGTTLTGLGQNQNFTNALGNWFGGSSSAPTYNAWDNWAQFGSGAD